VAHRSETADATTSSAAMASGRIGSSGGLVAAAAAAESGCVSNSQKNLGCVASPSVRLRAFRTQSHSQGHGHAEGCGALPYRGTVMLSLLSLFGASPTFSSRRDTRHVFIQRLCPRATPAHVQVIADAGCTGRPRPSRKRTDYSKFVGRHAACWGNRRRATPRLRGGCGACTSCITHRLRRTRRRSRSRVAT